jgi:hypothetical protein
MEHASSTYGAFSSSRKNGYFFSTPKKSRAGDGPAHDINPLCDRYYFLNFLLIPASPAKPELKRNIVAGSGTGLGAGEDSLNVKLSITYWLLILSGAILAQTKQGATT